MAGPLFDANVLALLRLRGDWLRRVMVSRRAAGQAAGSTTTADFLI
jgi:hypothetical protein